MSYDFPALRCSFSQNTPHTKNTQHKTISYTKNQKPAHQQGDKNHEPHLHTPPLLHRPKDKEADNKPRLIDYVEDFITIGTNYITTKTEPTPHQTEPPNTNPYPNSTKTTPTTSNSPKTTTSPSRPNPPHSAPQHESDTRRPQQHRTPRHTPRIPPRPRSRNRQNRPQIRPRKQLTTSDRHANRR